jgi:hypothetical protein
MELCRVSCVPRFVVLASTFGHAVCLLDESKHPVYSEDLRQKKVTPTHGPVGGSVWATKFGPKCPSYPDLVWRSAWRRPESLEYTPTLPCLGQSTPTLIPSLALPPLVDLRSPGSTVHQSCSSFVSLPAIVSGAPTAQWSSPPSSVHRAWTYILPPS